MEASAQRAFGVEMGSKQIASGDADFHVRTGTASVYFAYDIGFGIDLDKAERLIQHATHRQFIRRTRKAPRYFQYRPPPLRVDFTGTRVEIAGFATDTTTEIVLYDFGAVSVMYRIPLSGPLSSLKSLGLALYDNESLLADSRLRVEQLMDTIRPAVAKPGLRDLVEDYVIFQVTQCTPMPDPDRVVTELPLALAQLLRAETDALSEQEIADSLAHRISFGAGDLMIIDWNAAFVLGTGMEDALAVLEFANVELLEMRFLDDQLDQSLSQAYGRFASPRPWRSIGLRHRAAELEEIARLQLDSAILFEGVNNTLKLLGDPYLARVYRLASQRFHLTDWDASILRKISAVESIYSKISDRQSALRMEALEWIIIVLIAISIILSFQ